MVHAKTFAAQLRFSEHDQLLAGRDHFLHVMQIEPAQDEWLTQSIRVRFLKRCFEDFFPTTKAKHSRLDHLAAKTNRHIALFVWKFRELMSIFIAPRIMGYQIFHLRDGEPPQCS